MHSAKTAMILAAAGGMADPLQWLQPAPLRVDQINWRWRNQRQVRKNRRRAHAAGKRNAFA